MLEYIIDILKEEYKDFPITLNGEVFLEKMVDNQGNFSGYLTIPIETIAKIKALSEEDFNKSGWVKYKNIFDSFE